MTGKKFSFLSGMGFPFKVEKKFSYTIKIMPFKFVYFPCQLSDAFLLQEEFSKINTIAALVGYNSSVL